MLSGFSSMTTSTNMCNKSCIVKTQKKNYINSLMLRNGYSAQSKPQGNSDSDNNWNLFFSYQNKQQKRNKAATRKTCLNPRHSKSNEQYINYSFIQQT